MCMNIVAKDDSINKYSFYSKADYKQIINS